MGAGDEERILPMLCDETPCVDNEKDKADRLASAAAHGAINDKKA